MATPIKPKRGLSTSRNTQTPQSGELTLTTDTKKLYVGDGSTAGGISLNYVDNFSNETVAGNKTFSNDVVVSGNLTVGSTSIHDASMITSGIFDLARIPRNALERLHIVADETARFALSTNDVQNGDTVKEVSTGKMYFIKDDTKLNLADGYEVYATGAEVSSVNWSNILDRPSTFAPSTHNQDASTITTGVFSASRVPGLDAAKISTGTVNVARLPTLVGDSGAGGTAGMVPAPSAGDAAAGKVLTAAGSWAAMGSNATHTGDVTGATALTIANKQILTSSANGINISNSPTVIAQDVPMISLDYGESADTVCQGNDPRLSNARTPIAHNHAATEITSGTVAVARLPAMVGDSGSGGTAGLVPAPASGDAAAGKVLSAAGTWTAISSNATHTGDVTGATALTITNKQTLTASNGINISNSPTVIASAAPALSLTYGTAVNTVCQGNDARLSDARTPTAHNQTASTITDFDTAVSANSTVTGKVAGAASSVDGDLMVFSGTTGKIAKVPTININSPVAINTKRASVASAATTNIWAALANEIDLTGTATITNFDAAPQAGASRVLHCAGACVFSHNANIFVQGNANFTAAAGDVIYVHAITTTTFRLTIRQAATLGGGGGGGITTGKAVAMAMIFS
jgi:hypothetical protein